MKGERPGLDNLHSDELVLLHVKNLIPPSGQIMHIQQPGSRLVLVKATISMYRKLRPRALQRALQYRTVLCQYVALELFFTSLVLHFKDA